MSQAPRQSLPPAAHAALATLVLCIATVCYTFHMPDFTRFLVGMNDFLPRYSQARFVGAGDLYDVKANYREQDHATGMHISGLPDRLPWEALLMAPLSRLPYLWAYWIWIGINLAAFFLLVLLWLAPRGFALWGAVFFPVAATLILGQDGILLSLCLAGTLLLAKNHQDWAAGLVLALCTAKPHLFVLVPLALIVHRRWSIVYGAIVGTTGLLILGTVAAGWDWPARLWPLLKSMPGDWHAVGTRPTVFELGVNSVSIAVAIAVAIVFVILIWRSSSLEAGIGAAFIGSLLIAPHGAVYDLPILLVALLAMPLPSHARRLRFALLTPIPYWLLLRGSPWTWVFILMLLATAAASTLAPPDSSEVNAAIPEGV
ncbi:MAG: glycosyltransferase family 87 protein [Bryobacteraceae bacterium]